MGRRRWHLIVAERKCVETIEINSPTTHNLKGVQLLNVNIYRDIGVLVDDHCLFKQHISYICCKAYSAINLIFHCFHIDVHIKAYRSCDRPILEYCSTV